MNSFEAPQEKNSMQILAEKLNVLQSVENEGRGITCIRAIITELNNGNIEGAKAIYNNEGDKIKNYPEIKQLLEKEFGE